MTLFKFDGPCVYAIVNLINGRRYIGSTISFQSRIGLHRNQLRRQAHENRHLQAAWNKYGEDAFVFGVVEEALADQIIEKEQLHLDIAQPNVYNIGSIASPAARGLKRSLETRERLRKAAMVRVAAGTNSFDRLTPEQMERRRKTLSAVNMGQKRPESTKARLREAWVLRPRRKSCGKGHVFSLENTYLHGGTRHCAACMKRARDKSNRRVSETRKALRLINARSHAA